MIPPEQQFDDIDAELLRIRAEIAERQAAINQLITRPPTPQLSEELKRLHRSGDRLLARLHQTRRHLKPSTPISLLG
jgi:hypothetical protein